jgi:hypothetical protein
MSDIKRMIDNALSFGNAYADDRAPSEAIMTRPYPEDMASDTVKLATALHFIADNLSDVEDDTSASEKLAEAELLMAYLRESYQDHAVKVAEYRSEQFHQPSSARSRLTSILSK